MDLHYDKSKLRELILYVADSSVDDANFGATKLNKILFFSDFIAYAELGAPITGAIYQKLDHGPAPRALLPIRQELIDEDAAAIVPTRRFTHLQKRLVALREADLSLFKPEEIALVDSIIETLRGETGNSVSDLSHDWAVGWEVAAAGDDIPYATVFWDRPILTRDDANRGRELADEHGWLAGV